VGADESAASLTVRATSTYDTTKFRTITVKVCEITGFRIGSYSGTISGTNITVIYPYDESSQITSLGPYITATSNATVSPSSGRVQDFTTPVTYTLNGDPEAAYTVTVKNSRTKITGFSFANPPTTGGIDETAKTINVMVPYTTNITAMAPTVSVSSRAALSPPSGTVGNFTNPVLYTVTAENGDTATYTVTVTVLGQGGVTLIYPEDEAAGAFPDTIILSKSGTGG
jgi:hypothetical protein